MHRLDPLKSYFEVCADLEIFSDGESEADDASLQRHPLKALVEANNVHVDMSMFTISLLTVISDC